jgi:hypothetical protein
MTTRRTSGRCSLHEVLGLEPQPVRFVDSLGLDEEPSPEQLSRRLAARARRGCSDVPRRR